ncbi:MAG: peptide/nickel transport system permease protein [Solirubrobacteraceae bacterium]|jgi:peptide/nickel transport system permease protein|nr:binding-protein-dependent transport system inner rane component [Solirubrobacterales bacterium]MEA2208960.1 peptide/nickel transport system permease protein [Solirubrobacteraceae bacterium]
MSRYIIRRLLWGVLLLIAVSALTFVLFRILPTADPAKLRAGRLQNPKIIAEIRHDLGLDKSLPEQFWLYMKGIFLHFNLGFSYYSNAPVKELIFNRLPATLSLVVGGAVVWLVAGLTVGVVSARRAGSRLDRASMGTALVLVSAPEYWLGLLMLFFFASDIGKVHVFPGAGSYVGLTAEPAKWFTSMIMPWLVVAAGTAAIYARLIRGSLIETMGEDYIRTARAKGLTERRVVLRHGLRSAINPIVTILGIDIAILLGSSVLVETVFDIPGIGRLNYIAITHSDYPIIQGTVLFASLFVVVANIVVDIVYAFLDPRVRYS